MEGGEAPAWMACEDIITRLKDELVLEAIDILHEEMRAGRIDIQGYVSLLPDRSDEIQRDMYIINNLRMREGEIVGQYSSGLDGSAEKDPKKLQRMEDLRKFIMSVKAISILMAMSEVAGAWADDVGRHSDIDDPELIISKTLGGDGQRGEVLRHALSSPKFLKSEALSNEEISMLKRAINRSR